jgi:hypothetical protein
MEQPTDLRLDRNPTLTLPGAMLIEFEYQCAHPRRFRHPVNRFATSRTEIASHCRNDRYLTSVRVGNIAGVPNEFRRTAKWAFHLHNSL